MNVSVCDGLKLVGSRAAVTSLLSFLLNQVTFDLLWTVWVDSGHEVVSCYMNISDKKPFMKQKETLYSLLLEVLWGKRVTHVLIIRPH